MFLIYIFQTKTKSDFGVSQNPICLRSEPRHPAGPFLIRFFKASESENDADDRRDGDIYDGVQVFELRQLDRDRDDREQDQRFPGKQCGDTAHVKDGGPGVTGEEGDEQHGEPGGGDQADRGGTKPGKDGFDDPVFGILIHDPGDGEDDEEFRQDQTEGR